ncbi:MAG: hypothetical protein JKY55_06015 [Aliivibrio sp.]|uniref:hypothetical protein n=1 Tax=Aliivibrio sp. TaxID=1872443 RepID=UPI001A3B3221|nr:hypothetical protein [Aliivibrio sp.]
MVKALDMQRVTRLDKDLVYEFLVVFLRLEYAAKMNEFVVPLAEGEQERKLTVLWEDVSDQIEENWTVALREDDELKNAADYYDTYPPEKQILTTDGIEFKNTEIQNVASSLKLLLAVRRVRNNLFHGGKASKSENVERSSALLRNGITIILGAVQCNVDLSMHFHEDY